MLSIWIGRAGAGKSRRVLETMARQRSQRPQVLLVPGQRWICAGRWGLRPPVMRRC